MGQSDPWSKKWWVIFWNDGPKHIKLTIVDIWVVYFTYTLTQTLVCIYVHWYFSIKYSKTCLKWPLKKEDHLLLNAGQKYCRMLQGEHSAILSTFIKLPFVIKIFVFSFLSGCLRYILLYWLPTWNHGTMTRAHHKSEGLWFDNILNIQVSMTRKFYNLRTTDNTMRKESNWFNCKLWNPVKNGHHHLCHC